jgi:hypothetical protein
MRDDAEWNDMLGMLKVQGMVLNFPLLERYAQAFHITDAWRSILMDAGLQAAEKQEALSVEV